MNFKDQLKSVKNWIIVLLIGVSLWFNLKVSRVEKDNSVLEQQKELTIQGRDTLKSTYDSDEERWVLSRLGYKADKEVLEDHLKKNEPELYKLKKKYGGSSTGLIAGTESKSDTVVLSTKDTTQLGEVRTAIIETPWVSEKIVSYPDTMHVQRLIRDTVEVAIGNDGRINIMNRNPEVKVTSLAGYIEKAKPQKKKNGKYIVGAILGVGATILLTK